MSQRLYNQGQRRGILTTVGVKQMVPGEARPPIFQHWNKSSFFNMRFYKVVRQISDPQIIQCALQYQESIVEHGLAGDPDTHRLATFFKIPRI